MALDYDDIFTKLGKVIKGQNYVVGIRDTGFESSDFASDYLGTVDPVALAVSAFYGMMDDMTSRAESYVNAFESYLAQEFLLADLPYIGSDTDVPTILQRIIDDMIAQSDTVRKSVVTLGTPTAAFVGSSTGKMAVSKVLDGSSIPIAGGFAHPSYAGIDSELCQSDTVVLECIADSQTDGQTEGGEIFTIQGLPAPRSPLDYLRTGVGTGPNISVMNKGAFGSFQLPDPDFETFVSNVPDGWVVVSGTAGTNILEETTGANVYHGSRSLRFTNGAAATIEIKYPMSTLKPNKRYCFGIWLKSDATAAGATLIQMEGTGYSAGTTEKISVAAASYTGSWEFHSFFFNSPEIIPSDFALHIKVTGTLTATKSVWYDWFGFSEAVWFNGFCMGLWAGNVRYIRGDRYTVSVSNNDAGLFNQFARRFWKMQFPSVASSETQPNSKAMP